MTCTAFAAVIVRSIGGKGKGVKEARVDAGADKIGREREAREMMQRFPPLHDLVDRDRLWPPNLGKLSFFIFSVYLEGPRVLWGWDVRL